MNNSDFSRLLATNDKALIQELTKAPAKKKNNSRPERKEKYANKGKGGKKGGGDDSEGKGKGKGSAGKGKAADEAPKEVYKDRAGQRRDGKEEYARVAAEFENQTEVTLADSKYLGGDMDHTHLVKGLDFALLSKVRGEMNKNQKKEELQDQRAKKRQKTQSFENLVAKQVWHTVVDTLHPHHTTFSKRMQSMGKALSLGQRIRNASSVFLPGRMAYEFDVGIEQGKQDIPRMVYMAKEDAPKVDTSKRVAPLLPETVVRVRNAIQKALEKKKLLKQGKAAGVAEGAYAVAQKVSAPRHKAKDDSCDIFGNVGSYAETVSDNLQIAKDKAAKAAKEAPKRSSYFDDAGAEKYKKAPEGQINPDDMVVEEKDGELGTADDDSKPAFEAVERFQGPRAGWVFKLGTQGLGYYREKEVSTSAAALAAPKEKKNSLRAAKKAARTEAPVDDDAYGECFPDSGFGGAVVTTADGDSDEEDGKKKKKEGAEEMDSSYGKKGVPIDPKKKKMSEGQQWEKIENIIKKGKVKSAGELDAMRPGGKRDGPVPRELTATPAYF